MKMPSKDLLNALNNNKQNIYVWVPVNATTRQSIRVSFAEAMEWVIQVSKQHDGVVPYFIGLDEVFLGSII
jgi:hypothetical protein